MNNILPVCPKCGIRYLGDGVELCLECGKPSEDKKLYKGLYYAYPSSPVAIMYAYGISGCWFVCLKPHNKPIHDNDIVYACLRKEKCIETMNYMKYDVDIYSL